MDKPCLSVFKYLIKNSPPQSRVGIERVAWYLGRMRKRGLGGLLEGYFVLLNRGCES